ncbi:MAG: photosystem II protein PsbQ [Leptolyngbyaceae cyanobacterium T60_A2020_046]|nr:photosystem II protein PsbQ [Leptolyngbyaceae cyanobacterium T60_A2020_046]
MMRYRSIVAVVLAAIATFIVGCGGPGATQVRTYSPEQIAEIEVFAPRVEELRARFPELEAYIQNKDWVNIRSFIHGPMGELRARLSRVAIRLLPNDAAQAKALADDLFVHLERLDAAAEGFDQIQSGKEYRLALDDFDAFLELIPARGSDAA